MKKNINDNSNKKYINETLAKSKTLTRSVNVFMQQNNLGNNNNINSNQNKNEQNNRKRKGSVNMPKIKEKKVIKEEDSSEEDEANNVDDDDEGIFTMEYVTTHIERYQKNVKKFDDLVKKNLLLSKKHPNRKDEYKDEAIRALKKKKFYSKALERYENKKLKLELKSLDREYQMQKKELKKLTKDLKRKVRLVTMGGHYDDDDIGGDDSGSDEEDNDAMFAQIDLDDNALNQQYEQIIAMPEVKNACDNLNLFKFIFQED
jgi:hypothetical protein